jgi:serine/threonine-protein phosphatase 2B regulatory subunit
MVQCLDGAKQILAVLFSCFDLELKQPRGLDDTQLLARETVCTFPRSYYSYALFSARVPAS